MRSTRETEARGTGIPAVLWIPAGLALAFLVLPIVALVLEVPWERLLELLSAPEVGTSLALSLVSAVLATALSLLFGVPLAWVLARSGAWPVIVRRLLRALVTVPLVLPPVVGGIALLLLLGRRGLLGQYLDAWFDVQIPFTMAAVVIAETFVAMPFLVLAVEGALRAADRRYEDVAALLGASRWVVFWRITLPLIAPGVAAGAVLCFARALGEFGATITFAGNFPGVTQTMPLSAYLALQTNPDAAYALSLVLLTVSIAVLVSLRDRWVAGVTT
ncbi:MAG: molybdenum transporter permease [Microbacteriaceae bacterium]|nr:molybdenum transporter permease [Microbacteriaceae bacterium]HEV7956392.1 molybdate ABC transporter permease subunit [Marisediminicola sp.]